VSQHNRFDTVAALPVKRILLSVGVILSGHKTIISSSEMIQIITNCTLAVDCLIPLWYNTASPRRCTLRRGHTASIAAYLMLKGLENESFVT
jgi:hypothetical protein